MDFSRIEIDLKSSLNPRNLLESVCVSLVKNDKEKGLGQENKNASEIAPAMPQVRAEIKENLKIDTNSLSAINQNVNGNNSANNIDKKQDIKENPSNVSTDDVGRIWGEVLIKVKEKNMFAFSASLKNIYGVQIDGTRLLLHTNDKGVLQAVDLPDKKEIILNILKELGSSVDSIEVKYDETSKSQQDIIKELKDTFLDKIKIK